MPATAPVTAPFPASNTTFPGLTSKRLSKTLLPDWTPSIVCETTSPKAPAAKPITAPITTVGKFPSLSTKSTGLFQQYP